ncbi:MAG: Ig-like domain-containing protein [Chitinophagaceae bacterium]|nr:Ig-like domain-containing protein [Chitinophagaceae bacterium]
MNKATLNKTVKCISLSLAALFAVSNSSGQIINTIAGTGTGGHSGDGGAATAANFYNPAAIKRDAVGNLYIADFSNHRVRKIDTFGVVTTIAGNGTATYAGDGGAATAASIRQPAGIALDGSGNIYISDNFNNRIRKVDASGNISTIAGNGTGGYSGDGGAATAAMINRPTGISTDATGNIYFADESNNVIRKVTVSTGVITTVAGNGIAGYSTGVATGASLKQPKDVAVDASGNIYIADWMNHRVRMVNSSGNIVDLAGDGTMGFSGDGYVATASKLNKPISIWIDASGNLLVADNGNNRLRKIYLAGAGHIATICGNGTSSFSGDGGPATAAGLRTPMGMVSDASGIIYFADQGNHRIRKIATVAPPPPTFIVGTTSLCEGTTTTLGASVSGGTWTSGSTTTATIDASGVVTALTAGTTIITYMTSTGMDTALITVHPQPAAITGASTVCIAATTPYSCTSAGGTWTSSNSATAIVDATGNVMGIAAGSATISYTLTGGCNSSLGITVIACPTNVNETSLHQNTFAVFPNPSQGQFSITIPPSKSETALTITDVMGRAVQTLHIQPGSLTTKQFVSDLQAGIYIVSITNADNKDQIKVSVGH